MKSELPDKTVLAMYDVRGIQSYIFHTSKLKDAIGASYIVETLIQDALKTVEKKISKTINKEITVDLEWENETGIVKYEGEDKDIQVLYIGGGNAYVLYSSESLCREANRIMSKYVLEHTYSLQLAIATCEKTDSYADDYKKIHSIMNRIKADMADTRPVGAFPVMRIEYQTGLPVVQKDEGNDLSRETQLKRTAEKKVRPNDGDKEAKVFDSYIDEKGTDSTLAVVHIDGNNMGLRIKELIQDKIDYVSAVNSMRQISYNINHCYKDVFNEMRAVFNAYEDPETQKTDYYVLKVLTAGDDITYVCNGKIAVATVQYFSREISRHCMNEHMEGEDLEKFGFSVCAGISYIKSHFPFSIGYEVAENCCEQAKKRAKEVAKEGKVGNFFDFQFCKNVQTKDLEDMRECEYMTPSGEMLLIRPYGFESGEFYDFEHLKSQIKWLDGNNLPRSFAKTLRNTYPLGKTEIIRFISFLNSRKWKLPEIENGEKIELENIYVNEGSMSYARFYDALELMDDYIDLEEIESKEAAND